MKRNETEKRGMTRREFQALGAAAVVAAAGAWWTRTASAETEAEGLATEYAENEMLLKGIGFVAESEKEGQQCANCMLYTAGEGGRGKCQIVQKGLVPEGGWCLSWAAKP